MFLTLKEVVKWLGITAFEIWLSLLGLLCFTILLALKLEGVLATTSWWTVFIPLFTVDGMNAYFCIIVFIRTCQEKDYRGGALRLLSSILCLVCLFVCKFLFCKKLSGDNERLSYGEIFAPVIVALQILMVRACQVH